MPLSTSQIRLLKRRAADNSLEVENLLRVAVSGAATDAALLRQLRAAHAWSDTGRDGGARVVPFGRWADVVCCYLEQGYAGLVKLTRGRRRDDFAPFCFAVLEGLRTPEAVDALLAIGGSMWQRPAADKAWAVRLAGAVNQLVGFKGAPAIGEAVTAKLRTFLHRLLALDLSERERYLGVCALRGVGDTSSLEVIAGLPRFRGDNALVVKLAVREITKRLRHGARQWKED